QNLSDAEQGMFDSFSKIRQSLNLDPGVPLKIDYDFSPEFFLPSENSLISLAIKKRPDLLAEREEALVQSNKVKLAKANGFPDLDIGVELDRQGPQFANTFGGGIGIAIPLFNRNQGDIETAEAQENQEEYLLRSKENEVLNKVKTAYDKYKNSLEVLRKLSPSALADARKVREMAVKSYAAGNIGLVELLQTEQVYTDAIQSYYGALQEFFMNRIGLERAIGRDIFEEDIK
ncbi:MAG: TolC family protein, partial [Candidatus Kryptoniota bacterium]